MRRASSATRLWVWGETRMELPETFMSPMIVHASLGCLLFAICRHMMLQKEVYDDTFETQCDQAGRRSSCRSGEPLGRGAASQAFACKNRHHRLEPAQRG